MILYWLVSAVAFAVRLFRLPSLAEYAAIEVNEKCPACGHRKGKLRCIATQAKDLSMVVEHTCEICGARWYSETVRESKDIHPAA